MTLAQYMRDNYLIFDGAMGTMLQAAGLPAGQMPELLNVKNPEILLDIHRQYAAAGCDVATANTFGANEFKLPHGLSVEETISAGIRIAKASGARYTALDIGPTGRLMKPMGDMGFEEAYAAFARQVKAGVHAGADVIIIETFSDLYEVKAAVLAARENSALPVFCTMTFESGGRTFLGADPMTAAVTLSAYGVDALGVNCSRGPEELIPIVETMLEYARVPVIVQANAGLPRMDGSATSYDVTPDEYLRHIGVMAGRGARILGGCCGTTPEHIALIARTYKRKRPIEPSPRIITACTSGSRTVVLDGRTTVIGERINPTGKPKLKRALTENRLDYILGEAIDQTQSGADVLDVNVGLPGVDEPKMLKEVIQAVQGVTNLPLQIDSASVAAIEQGLRVYNGKPLVNSVNGKREVMEKLFPIVKKYGALVLGLTLDENGIPETAEGRFAIAERILETALSYGVPRENVLIDCLTLTASAQGALVMETLKAVRMVRERLGLHTVLGVSNVSFGLPNRPLLNAAFLSSALGAGLSAPIINPMAQEAMRAVSSFRVFTGEDAGASSFIAKHAQEQRAADTPSPEAQTLDTIIIDGRKPEAARATEELLKSQSAMDIINGYMIPALDTVGKRFETGEIFLPQLIQSAETVKLAFDVINDMAAADVPEPKGRIILATVRGDIHDIGKNIVKMLLTSYGYDVIDLGKDVPPEAVVDAAKKHNIRLVGLSALMTTTVESMAETIHMLRASGHDCKVVVGGAVLTPEYAKMVGADFYAKDAQESVRVANRVFGK